MSQGTPGSPAQDGMHALPTESLGSGPPAAAPGRSFDPNQTIDLAQEEIKRALSASLPQQAPPPLEVEGYEISTCIGEGTFGEVWKGKHRTTGVQVAVKFLLRTRDRTQLQAMREETRKLALLHSDPRIVRLIDVDADATPPYFIMDYAEQGSLAGRLARGKMAPAEAMAIFRPVVEAMAYVHAKGIRHCDLKPGNILLDAAGRPKVADFGQAQLSIEPTTSALGTFFYMVPEQAGGERQVPDASWDVYGLGALLYAMLTGEPPRFDKKCKHELEHTLELTHRLARYRDWVATCPAPTGHRQIKGVDSDLADVIDRCLALDPAQRLRDAGDLLAALDARDAATDRGRWCCSRCSRRCCW